jgi:phosphoribosylaminoimidazolecarboxamide formyltransferase / IMP cyclohydrolase
VTKVRIKRALVSVYDKAGLADLVGALAAAGVQIVSTGSTAAAIAAAGVPVTAVEEVTGFPEILHGRVKTLHPGVHAGLLADTSRPGHAEQLEALGIATFELLVSNLYPFEATVAAGATAGECVEQIDIGGPAMVRAAAKNHARVAVITDPSQYREAVAAVRDGGFTREQRRRLAAAAYAATARYDAAVATWFATVYAPDEVARETGWPDLVSAVWTRREVLRYGENPHQGAALYVRPGAPPGLATATQLHGKAMSYNNYGDAAAAWRTAFDFAEPCVAIIKHANPCGIAIGADVAEAHRKAHACDPVSAYGGVIAANREVTAAMAAQLADIFTEVIVAPGFEDAALDKLTAKKNLRLLRCPPPGAAPAAPEGTSAAPQAGPEAAPSPEAATPPSPEAARPPETAVPGAPAARAVEWRPVDGGVLLQTTDLLDAPGDDPATWQLRAGKHASAADLADLAFAWRACRAAKSNAIVLASGGATVGVGMGQVNRVDSARIAVARSGQRSRGAIAASDAFFPFPDGLRVLADAGVRAIVEPGGSVRDEEVIAAAQAAGVSLYFTGTRHFYH